jgi:hypothetical protein
LEKEFLAKRSSGSNVILEEIQDTSHNIISETDQIIPPLDTSANEHLEEPNPQVSCGRGSSPELKRFNAS